MLEHYSSLLIYLATNNISVSANLIMLIFQHNAVIWGRQTILLLNAFLAYQHLPFLCVLIVPNFAGNFDCKMLAGDKMSSGVKTGQYLK